MRMLFLLVYICSFWNQRVDWRHKWDSSLPVLRYWLCHWREFRISDNKSIFIKDERILVLNRQIPVCRNNDASIPHVCKWRTASKMYVCFSPKCPKKPFLLGMHLNWPPRSSKGYKKCTRQKARFYRAFLLPKRRFTRFQKRRWKNGFFPLKIDTNPSNNLHTEQGRQIVTDATCRFLLPSEPIVLKRNGWLFFYFTDKEQDNDLFRFTPAKGVGMDDDSRSKISAQRRRHNGASPFRVHGRDVRLPVLPILPRKKKMHSQPMPLHRGTDRRRSSKPNRGHGWDNERHPQRRLSQTAQSIHQRKWGTTYELQKRKTPLGFRRGRP